MEIKFNDLKLNSDGLIPAIAQDAATGEVLMMAYMNEEAFVKTAETKKAHYFSRSRDKLWLKGEQSGHYQNVMEMYLDCDNDTILLKIEQVGGSACHTGERSCFFNRILEGNADIPDSLKASVKEENGKFILQEVYDVICDRRINPKEGSYTNYLFDKGIDKMLKKVGEEAAEVIIASKNPENNEVRYEIADLFYHLFVVMVQRGVTLEEIYHELKGRR